MKITIDTENMTREELIALQKELNKAAISIWQREQTHKQMAEHLCKVFDGVSIDNGIVNKK